MKMVNMTLVIPEDLRKKMRKHDEVNWSAVVRKALKNHLEKIEKTDRIEAIAQKSKLTQKDADEIAHLINRDMAKDFGLIK